MVDVLGVIPYRSPAFNRKWFLRVFEKLHTACLFLGHPSTKIVIHPSRDRATIHQDGCEIPLEARYYVYLPPSYERQHTGLAKIRRSRYQDFVSREWDVVTQFLEEHLIDSAKCVNPPLSARRAANKLLQLVSAKPHGLDIPPTVVTNSAQEAIKILPPGSSRGLWKPIGESGNITSDLMAPASLFTRAELLADPASIEIAPGCFQRFIAAKRELRTYIFGARAVSILIRPRDKISTPDLTCQNLEEDDFSRTEGFKDHESKLIGLVKDLGLRYAAVDSIIAGQRRYFLEVNPNGGWGWLPKDMQAPLDHEFRQLVLDR